MCVALKHNWLLYCCLIVDCCIQEDLSPLLRDLTFCLVIVKHILTVIIFLDSGEGGMSSQDVSQLGVETVHLESTGA